MSQFLNLHLWQILIIGVLCSINSMDYQVVEGFIMLVL
jgi:hypothetical protein